MSDKEIDKNSEEFQKAVEAAAELRYKDQFKADYDKGVEGLLNKNQELIEEKRTAKTALDDINNRYDFEKFDAQMAEAEKLRQQEMSHEERWEYRRDEMLQGFEVERKDMKALLDRKDHALKKNLIDAQLTSALVEAGAQPYLAQDVLSKHIQVVPEGDDFKARIMRDGNPRMYGASGEFMTIPQLVEEYKEDERYGTWFGSSGVGGGGAKGNIGDALPKGTADLQRSKMTVKQKSDYVKEHGQEKYFALMA